MRNIDSSEEVEVVNKKEGGVEKAKSRIKEKQPRSFKEIAKDVARVAVVVVGGFGGFDTAHAAPDPKDLRGVQVEAGKTVEDGEGGYQQFNNTGKKVGEMIVIKDRAGEVLNTIESRWTYEGENIKTEIAITRDAKGVIEEQREGSGGSYDEEGRLSGMTMSFKDKDGNLKRTIDFRNVYQQSSSEVDASEAQIDAERFDVTNLTFKDKDGALKGSQDEFVGYDREGKKIGYTSIDRNAQREITSTTRTVLESTGQVKNSYHDSFEYDNARRRVMTRETIKNGNYEPTGYVDIQENYDNDGKKTGNVLTFKDAQANVTGSREDLYTDSGISEIYKDAEGVMASRIDYSADGKYRETKYNKDGSVEKTIEHGAFYFVGDKKLQDCSEYDVSGKLISGYMTEVK